MVEEILKKLNLPADLFSNIDNLQESMDKLHGAVKAYADALANYANKKIQEKEAKNSNKENGNKKTNPIIFVKTDTKTADEVNKELKRGEEMFIPFKDFKYDTTSKSGKPDVSYTNTCCGNKCGNHSSGKCKKESASTFNIRVDHILYGIRTFLCEKNRRYGNSALEPSNFFYKGDSEEGLRIRIDDKLKRIKNSEELRKNDVVDLIGYLILLCLNKKWVSFDEFID